MASEIVVDDELEGLTQRWINAWLERDIETIAGLMAPEYRYVGPRGEVLDRERILGIAQDPEYRLTWGGRSEIVISRPAADAALIVSRWRGEGRFEGHRFSDDQRCTTVLVRRHSRWLIVHEHCSQVKG
jgi:uncharacterized protein (TIGR02246 family)